MFSFVSFNFILIPRCRSGLATSRTQKHLLPAARWINYQSLRKPFSRYHTDAVYFEAQRQQRRDNCHHNLCVSVNTIGTDPAGRSADSSAMAASLLASPRAITRASTAPTATFVLRLRGLWEKFVERRIRARILRHSPRVCRDVRTRGMLRESAR